MLLARSPMSWDAASCERYSCRKILQSAAVSSRKLGRLQLRSLVCQGSAGKLVGEFRFAGRQRNAPIFHPADLPPVGFLVHRKVAGAVHLQGYAIVCVGLFDLDVAAELGITTESSVRLLLGLTH